MIFREILFSIVLFREFFAKRCADAADFSRARFPRGDADANEVRDYTVFVPRYNCARHDEWGTRPQELC